MGAANGQTQAAGRVRAHGALDLLVVLAVALLLLTAACSSGDDDESASKDDDEQSGGGNGDDPGDDTGREATTTTAPTADEPAGTVPSDVYPYLQALLERYDEVVTEIVADPSVVSDDDHPLVQEFLGLFESGSEFAAGSIEGWQHYGGTGITLTPSTGETVSETTLDGPVQTVDDDEVTFGHCTVLHYVQYRNGEETDRAERDLLPGNGSAVRVDGHWLLVDISTPPDIQGCIRQGGGQ